MHRQGGTVLAALALVLSPTAAVPSVTFSLPATGETLPDHWSGTNCVCSATASATGEHFTEARLIIVDTDGATEVEVASWTWPGGQQEVPVKTLRAQFVSNHFPHGFEMVYKMKVKTNTSNDWIVSDPLVKSVYNVGVVYEYPGFSLSGTGTEAARIGLEQTKHDVSRFHRGGNWTSMQFLNDLGAGTALHIGTHGTAGGSLVSGAEEIINPSDVLGARTTARDNGLPPMNFAYFDVCLVGQCPTLGVDILFPGSTVDRAAIAYNVSIDSRASPDVSEVVWEGLAAKLRPHDLVTPMRQTYKKLAHDMGFDKISEDNIVIWGDEYTRLWGLYSGNAPLPTQNWYRQVS